MKKLRVNRNGAEKWSGVRTPNQAFERQGKLARTPLWTFERLDLAFERQGKMARTRLWPFERLDLAFERQCKMKAVNLQRLWPFERPLGPFERQA